MKARETDRGSKAGETKALVCGECRFFGVFHTERARHRVCSRNMAIRRRGDACLFAKGGAR